MEHAAWSDSFMRKDICVSPDDYSKTCTEILDHLVDCPMCGYKFEDWQCPKQPIINFYHHNKTRSCQGNMVEIRTEYHAKRSAFLALGGGPKW